jgi:uroporphyrinogen-III synthase
LPVDKELRDKFFQDLTSGKIDAIVFGSGLSAKNIFKMLTEKASMETLRALINSKVSVYLALVFSSLVLFFYIKKQSFLC